MTITEWFADLIGDDTVNKAATRAGVNQSTLSRQLAAGRISPELVVPLARAYGYDAIEALVTEGLLSREDVARHDVRATLAAADDRELAAEVYDRMQSGRGGNLWDEPVGESRLRPVPDMDTAAAMEGDDPSIDDEQP